MRHGIVVCNKCGTCARGAAATMVLNTDGACLSLPARRRHGRDIDRPVLCALEGLPRRTDRLPRVCGIRARHLLPLLPVYWRHGHLSLASGAGGRAVDVHHPIRLLLRKHARVLVLVIRPVQAGAMGHRRAQAG
eukprot:scaffold8247_cov116-Isochrysis_galbana.AAC.5